jgi:small subunit ribosomal protein S16
LAVRIRLTRVGATKRPAYRVIAIDKRRSRDGRALEILGFYDPLTEPATVHLESDRIQAWIGNGAQPSETVVKLMRQAEKNAQAAAAGAEAEKPKRSTRATKPKASKKAAAKAEAAPAADAASPEATAESDGGSASSEAAADAASTPEAAAEAPPADEPVADDEKGEA